MTLTSSQAVLIDDFNNYLNTTYIQAQNSAWSRFGAATTDGISSIAGGADGTRGAAYSVNFTGNVTGSVKYTFATPQNFTTTYTVTLDMDVPLSLSGTLVQAVLYDAADSQSIFQTTAQSLTNASYLTYTFDFTTANTTRTQGTATLAEALTNVSAIGLRFSNSNGTGSASINFDNLSVVPEPTTTATLALAGVGFGFYALRNRQRARSQIAAH